MSTQELDQRDHTRAAWDAIAPAYDEHLTPFNFRFGEAVLGRLGVGPGMRFLDVAAGSGALAVPAARLGADVVAVDLSSRMIERLAVRARDEGLLNLDCRVMDGHDLELPDDTFDVSASQNGVSLFPDLGRGLSELTRVTRPGGRAVIVAFGPLPRAEFIGFFMGAMQSAVVGFEGLPQDPPPLPFQVAQPERLRQALAAAGLGDVTVETVTWRMEFVSAAQFWDVITNSNPIGAALVADLSGEQVTAVKQVLEGMLRERAGGSGPAMLTTDVNIGIGTR